MAMATKMVMVTATRVGEVGGRQNGQWRLSFFPVMLSALIIAVYCTVDIGCVMGIPCLSIAATNASL